MKFLNKQFMLLAAGSLATALLLAFLFPRFEWASLCWLALTPLIYVLRGSKLRGEINVDKPPGEEPEQFARTGWRDAFSWGWLSGFIYFTVSLSWIGHVSTGGMLLLAAYLGLGLGLWALVVAMLWHRNQILSSVSNLHFAFTAAAAWVVIEWLKSHLLTGFPWNNLGVCLYRNLPMIQIAEFSGVYGLSFVIVFVNVILLLTILRLDREIRLMIRKRNDFQVFRLRPHLDFTVAMVLLLGVYSYGLVSLFAPPGKSVVLRTALIQGNIPQDQKWNAERFYSIMETYEGLTQSAALAKPGLIVWPESATPAGFLQNQEVFDMIRRLTPADAPPLLFGSNDVVDKKDYTGAFLTGLGDGIFEIYHKMHLVPYGEYVPLRRWMPWLKKVVPIGDGFYPGRDPKVFILPPDNLRVAPLVCFEDIFPYLARQRALAGCDVFVNLTNGGWYGESAGIFQHVANAVFRSVETRRPTIRTTNTGVSCWIDPQGRIRDRMMPFVAGFQVCEVVIPVDAAVTFYTRQGDIFVVMCLLVLIAAIAGHILWQQKSVLKSVNS